MRAELGRREEAMMLEAQRASLEEGSNEVALAEEASRLAMRAEEYNLIEKEVPRDGNCQFHCVAQGLGPGGLGDRNEDDVRREAVQWLRENPDFRLNCDDADTTLTHYLDGDRSWEAYCDRMSRRGP
jgi:hypothetical protein